MISFDQSTEALLEALTQEVCVLSLEQVARLLRCDSREAQAISDRLSQAGYLSAERHLSSVDGEALEPLCSWTAGDDAPQFRRAAYLLRKRWQSPSETVLLYPTAKSCKLLGGTCVRPRSEGEIDHDLWVSEVYLHYREQGVLGSDLEWVSGDALRHRGEARQFDGLVPDACLYLADGLVERIVEAGGKSYAAAKLSKLHNCYSRVANYELW